MWNQSINRAAVRRRCSRSPPKSLSPRCFCNPRLRVITPVYRHHRHACTYQILQKWCRLFRFFCVVFFAPVVLVCSLPVVARCADVSTISNTIWASVGRDPHDRRAANHPAQAVSFFLFFSFFFLVRCHVAAMSLVEAPLR